MKKNKYTIINNPLDDYDFSFRRCHAAEIGAYIIGIMIFLLICALFVCSEENERKWKALRECFYIPIVFSVPLFLLGLSMTLRIRRLKKSIENGKIWLIFTRLCDKMAPRDLRFVTSNLIFS